MAKPRLESRQPESTILGTAPTAWTSPWTQPSAWLGSLDVLWCNPCDFRGGTLGSQAPKSPSVVLSTLPHCLPAIPFYFSFSKLCDLSVWGHERLITSVWTRRTVGRPCENFSHTLVPTGLRLNCTPLLFFLAVGLPGANQTHHDKLNQGFETETQGTWLPNSSRSQLWTSLPSF